MKSHYFDTLYNILYYHLVDNKDFFFKHQLTNSMNA